jgi:5,10-methenyltetrahydrofolate synthetase
MTASPQPAQPLPDPRTALRRRLREARTHWAQDASAWATAQAALQKNLLDVLRQLEPECLGLYWPIQAEFNPRPVALMAQREWGCALALPWAAKAGRQMHYRPWQGGDVATVDECGIPSPEGKPCEPDVVLVPCLGYTPDGFRLGYGGGYFDRFLAAHPEVTAVGVAWEHALIAREELAPQTHDVPLIGVVTELQIRGD